MRALGGGGALDTKLAYNVDVCMDPTVGPCTCLEVQSDAFAWDELCVKRLCETQGVSRWDPAVPA